MFSKNEKNLRDKYLKKYTKKEIFTRSIKLGKKNMFIKMIQYFLAIISEILKFKETNLNAEIIKKLTNKNFDNFMNDIFIYFACIIIDIIIYEINYYLNLKLKDVSEHNVLLENLLKKDMEFYDVFKTGELCDKCNYYGAFPYYDVIGSFLDLIKNIGTLFYSGYYLYNNFLLMGVISLIFFFLRLFINPYINNKVNLSEFEERLNLKNDILNEIFSNIRLIKSFGTEEKELKKLYDVSIKIRNDSKTIGFLKNMNSHLKTFNDMSVFYIMVKRCAIGEMEYSDLIIFNKYIYEFTSSLNYLLNIISSTLFGILEWRKFLEFYDIESKIFSKENAEIPKLDYKEEKEGLEIEFKNVDFSYPSKSDVQIFKNLSFKIPSGKVVAFVGYSGSGKTTITSLIQRFYDPNNGEIKINDINLKDLDLKWLRKNIGIVSQEPILNSCSIKDNIIYGVDSYSNELFKKVCEQSKVSDFVEDKNQFPLSYDTICGERGAVLSGGQKQRIAIARALIKNSKILIFDEATSALDAENECVVQNSINDIVKENKVTTIIIAHRLSTVKSADCIYVLDKGKICEFGTHDELIEKNGIYKQLIQNQI
jgi:ABC-type multidrug transport system fused ATPase/permease subunit